jgi:ABC-2 type transport system ATP-binding protein
VLSASHPITITPQAIRALAAAVADVVSITESRHSLEDVYLQLIDEDPEASRQ